MLDGLAKPTKGRVALWISLSTLWALFLPQQIANDPNFDDFSILGAIFWLIVLAGLVGMTITTLRRRARLAKRDSESDRGPTGGLAAGGPSQRADIDDDEPSQLA